ncbi:MAG: hypothetical protein AB8F74_20535 [Saprospiraceae bacterium]
MKSKLSVKPIFYLVIGLLSFIYVAIRAAKIGITFDESTTLGVFVPQSISAIYSYFTLMANNHWVNTYLIKLLYTFTGMDTIFLARLPNLVAMLFFLYYLYRICNDYLKGWWGLYLFMLLLLNPFLLDFFGMARGYGLAISFMTAGVYYLMKYGEQKKESHAVIALSLAVFSALSNFTYLIFFGAVYLAINSILFFKIEKPGNSLLIRINAIAIATLALIYSPIDKLKAGDALWYGGTNNFYTDTLYTLVDSSIGFANDPSLVYKILNSLLILFIAAVIFYFFSNKKERTLNSSPASILLLILTTCILGNIALHLLFDVKFLIHRTALIYFPLIITTLIFLISENKEKYSTYFMQGTMSLFLIAATFNFQQHYNYYSTISYFYDAPVTEVLEFIDKKGKAENKIYILDSTAIFKGSLRYNHWRKKYPNVVYIKDQPDNLDESFADYFLYLERPLSDFDYHPLKEQVIEYPRPVVMHFKKEGVVLFSNIGRGKQ